MIEMLMRDPHPIDVQEFLDIEMIVSGVLMPGSEESTARAQPRVHQQARRLSTQSESGMPDKRDSRHTGSISWRPLRHTPWIAQGGYVEGMNPMVIRRTHDR